MKEKPHSWERNKMELTSLDDCGYTDVLIILYQFAS